MRIVKHRFTCRGGDCVEEEINCIVKYSIEKEKEEEEVMKDNDRFVPINTEIICISILY